MSKMKLQTKPTKRPLIIIAITCTVTIAFAAVVLAAYYYHRQPGSVGAKDSAGSAVREFPDVATARLSPLQQTIVAKLRTEYKAQNPGTKYSEGVAEPWCADFVSWIMKEAGRPLQNPNSGSWRIPGTVTLREYYQAKGTFQPYDAAYQPKVGDVVLYDTPGSFGQHTNIVIKNENGILTTVGGNENGKIRVFKDEHPEKAAIIGYGVL